MNKLTPVKKNLIAVGLFLVLLLPLMAEATTYYSQGNPCTTATYHHENAGYLNHFLYADTLAPGTYYISVMPATSQTNIRVGIRDWNSNVDWSAYYDTTASTVAVFPVTWDGDDNNIQAIVTNGDFYTETNSSGDLIFSLDDVTDFCGTGDPCGNGTCDSGETVCNCSDDCDLPVPVITEPDTVIPAGAIGSHVSYIPLTSHDTGTGGGTYSYQVQKYFDDASTPGYYDVYISALANNGLYAYDDATLYIAWNDTIPYFAQNGEEYRVRGRVETLYCSDEDEWHYTGDYSDWYEFDVTDDGLQPPPDGSDEEGICSGALVGGICRALSWLFAPTVDIGAMVDTLNANLQNIVPIRYYYDIKNIVDGVDSLEAEDIDLTLSTNFGDIAVIDTSAVIDRFGQDAFDDMKDFIALVIYFLGLLYVYQRLISPIMNL